MRQVVIANEDVSKADCVPKVLFVKRASLWIYLPCFLMRSFPLPILSHCNRPAVEDRVICILWSFNSCHRQKVKN